MARSGVDVQVSLEDERKRREAAFAEEELRKAVTQRENLTVGKLFDAWLADGVRRLDDNAVLRRSFNADVLPKIGAHPLRTLSEHDLRAVLRAIVARGANRTAIMTRNNLMQMCSWAGKRQPWRKLMVEGDPMPDLPPPHWRRRCLGLGSTQPNHRSTLPSMADVSLISAQFGKVKHQHCRQRASANEQ